MVGEVLSYLCPGPVFLNHLGQLTLLLPVGVYGHYFSVPEPVKLGTGCSFSKEILKETLSGDYSDESL